MCCRLKEISKNGCNVDSIWYLSVMLQLWYQLTWYCWYWLKIANCALKLFLLTTWMYWLSEDSSTEWMIGFILLISISKTIQFVSIYYNLRNHFNVSMYCATWYFLSQKLLYAFLDWIEPCSQLCSSSCSPLHDSCLVVCMYAECYHRKNSNDWLCQLKCKVKPSNKYSTWNPAVWWWYIISQIYLHQ